ncbi:MAG: hypothetical protein D6675_16475 [Gemmatimonadetes bacterium]|nr:MAG: hypothetical protein D6675_16475 [Gemmatimonadota bacterium]
MILNAAQLIYANVEAEQSPQKQGGFQTLFYTHSQIDPAEREEIETRMLYVPSEVEPVKSIFFCTASGKVVIARIVSLPDPDSAGRSGRYLGHCLVLRAEDATQIGINPFDLFRSARFFHTVEAALNAGNFETGNIPPLPLTVNLTESDFTLAKQWSPAELKRLVLLFTSVERQLADRRTVAFIGDPEAVLQTIEAGWFVLPAQLRRKCTFDTYFYRCNIVATPYWGIGLLHATDNPRYSLVDVAAKQVRHSVIDLPQTAYECWVLSLLDQQRWSRIDRHKEQAFRLGNFIDQEEVAPEMLDHLPDEIIHEVFQFNADRVRQRLLAKIQENFPAELAGRVVEPIHQQKDATQLLHFLRKGFEISFLLDMLDRVYYAQKDSAPEKAEKNALARLLKTESHVRLNALLFAWNGKANALAKVLSEMPTKTYQAVVTRAVAHQWVERASLLYVRGRGEYLLRAYLAVLPAEYPDVVDVVKTLVRAKDTACLTLLIPHLEQFDRKTQETLTKWEDDLPPDVRQALAAILPPKKTGVLAKLRNILSGYRP